MCFGGQLPNLVTRLLAFQLRLHRSTKCWQHGNRVVQRPRRISIPITDKKDDAAARSEYEDQDDPKIRSREITHAEFLLVQLLPIDLLPFLDGLLPRLKRRLIGMSNKHPAEREANHEAKQQAEERIGHDFTSRSPATREQR